MARLGRVQTQDNMSLEGGGQEKAICNVWPPCEMWETNHNIIKSYLEEIYYAIFCAIGE